VISPAILTGGDEPATVPEVAEAYPADPAAVMAAAKAQAQADREAEKKSQAADKDASKQ
jgi:hypothetical protein